MHYPQALIETLRSAHSMTVLTGAGISAESGVPTFRDAQTGLWAQYRAEDLATPEAFQRDPKLVWEWYSWRRQLVSSVQPNAGHQALVTLECRLPDFHLITQNVDGLHQQAGSRQVIEMHGNLARIKCSREGVIVNDWKDKGEVPPRCPHCGAYLRPDVVWFGEMLPAAALAQAAAAAEACEVFLSIGTSTLVYPAAGLPFTALERGATVVEINPEPTPLSTQAQFSFRGAAGELLPELMEAVSPVD